MSKKVEAPFSKRHIQIFDDDWEFLTRQFGKSLGAGPAIRHIVKKAVRALRAREETVHMHQAVQQDEEEEEANK